MGICPTLSPEERVNNTNNKMLKSLLLQKLKDLTMYGFTSKLKAQIPKMENRYMFNYGILQDIQCILNIVRANKSIKSQSLAIETLEDELKNSCLIIQDEMYKNKNHQNQSRSLDHGEGFSHSMLENAEYQKNLAQNQSLVCQINIIYERQVDLTTYRSSLKLFLKWSSMFHEHFYAGFLKLIYKQFCKSIYSMESDDLESVVDETSAFVQYMVSIYTQIYHLKILNQSQNGSLFKNQNVFNLIMACIFKKTKIKIFVRKIIRTRQEKKIQKFAQKLKELQGKGLEYFGVEDKFRLKFKNPININEETEQNKLLEDQKQSSNCYEPYSSCLKSLQNLCENIHSQTPITKLKLIVNISKGITSQIYKYYDKMNKQMPDLDPDNLVGIIMYLIVKANKAQLYEQLKIAEYFTTSNCLTCISGYYLNTFNAAIESLLAL